VRSISEGYQHGGAAVKRNGGVLASRFHALGVVDGGEFEGGVGLAGVGVGRVAFSWSAHLVFPYPTARAGRVSGNGTRGVVVRLNFRA
jgi:hypothetical protein